MPKYYYFSALKNAVKIFIGILKISNKLKKKKTVKTKIKLKSSNKC